MAGMLMAIGRSMNGVAMKQLAVAAFAALVLTLVPTVTAEAAGWPAPGAQLDDLCELFPFLPGCS